jgi:hypothetical protein
VPDEDISCPSTYSPGRAVVMTTSFESSVKALKSQVDALPPDPSARTLEALLVQLEQIIQRIRAAGGNVRRVDGTAEIARHALSSGDATLAADSLRDAASEISAK